MAEFCLHKYVQHLTDQGRIITIKKPVNPVFEMAAILKKVNGETGVVFTDIMGYDQQVVSGLCGSREDWANYFGGTPYQVRERLVQALRSPLPWQEITEAPCQEIRYPVPVDLLKTFPIPKFSELDSGHFITAGVVIVKEPGTGNIHMSIRRLQVNSDHTISVLIESPGLMEQYLQYQAQGKDMEIAVAIGLHPVLLLASQINSQLFPVDKVAVAGALAGSPVPVVRCQTIDVLVPADAEIILEGKLVAHKRQVEGPFGELAGYYGPATDQPYMEITQVTSRNQPWFQTISPGSNEHKLGGALVREIVLLDAVRRVVPGVQDANVTMGGGGRFHAVVAINKQFEGEGKTALLAALGSNKDLKLVVVVNDDIDIFDSAEVEAAMASRMQADEDVFIVSGARGSSLEPSHNLRGLTAKMGIDATYPLREAPKFARIRTPGMDNIKLDDYL